MQTFATTFNDCARDVGYPDIPKIIEVREIGDPESIPWPPGFPIPDPDKPWTNGDTCPAMDPFIIYGDDLVRVSAVLVDHYQVYPSFAFRFDTEDGSVVFSGDTGPDTKGNLQRLAQGADVLVHEVIDEAWVEVTFKGVKQGEPAWPLYHHALTAHTAIKDVGRVARTMQGQDPGSQSYRPWQHARGPVAEGSGELFRKADHRRGFDADRRGQNPPESSRMR